MMSENKIQVTRYKAHKSGSLCGFFNVFIERFLSKDKKCGLLGVELNGLSHFNKDGNEFVSFPSREYTNAEGEKKYQNSVYITDRNNSQQLQDEILKAVQSYDKKEEELPKEELPKEDGGWNFP